MLCVSLLACALPALAPAAPAAAREPVFAAPATIGTADQPRSAVAADFDGNGRDDIAYADASAGEVVLQLSFSSGWYRKVLYKTATAAPVSLAVGNLDDDPRLEIAIADARDWQVAIVDWMTDGDVRHVHPAQSLGITRAVDVADVDGDGDDDLLAATSTGTYVWLRSGMTLAQVHADSWASTSVVAGNLTGEGSANILIRTLSDLMALQAHSGGGWYGGSACRSNATGLRRVGTEAYVIMGGANTVMPAVAGAVGCRTIPALAVTTGALPADVAGDDFDGDGLGDLASADYDAGEVGVYRRASASAYSAARIALPAPARPATVAAGDFDGDGDPDLAAAADGGAIVTYDNATDTVAPTTSDDVPAAFVAGPVTATLTASDAGGAGTTSGVSSTRVQVVAADGTPGEERAYDPDAKPVLGDGEKLRYWSIDAAGNVETARESAVVRVDADAPVTSADYDGRWAAGPVAVALTATDGAGVGVDAIRFRVVAADGTPGDAATYDPADPPVLEDGETLRMWALDALGNAETPHDTPAARIDRSAPTGRDDVPAWSTGPRPVRFTTEDGDGSGVDHTLLRIVAADGTVGPEQRFDPDAPPMLAAGEKVRYRVVDAVGNVGEERESVALQVETVAPSTTDDAAAGWHAGPYAVTLTAVDTGGSGVARIVFRVHDSSTGSTSDERVYDPDAKPLLSQYEYLSYRAIDVAGNVEMTRWTGVAMIDATAPTVSASLTTAWQRAPVPVTLTASDAQAGVTTITYRVLDADGEAGPERTYDPDAKPVLGDGERLRYVATDAVGNASEPQTTDAANVDDTPPVSTDDVPTGWMTGYVWATLQATDGGSGVAEIRYRVDGGDEHVYSPFGGGLLVGDGQKITYRAIDRAGNVEAWHDSAALRVDGVPPTASDDITGGWTSSGAVTFTAADTGGSGLDRIEYEVVAGDTKVSDGVWRPGDAGPMLAHGQHLRYAPVDVAGNRGYTRWSWAVAIDTTAPVVRDDVPEYGNASPWRVTLTASDSQAGVESIGYRIVEPDGTAGADQRQYSSSTEVTLTAGQRVQYWATDLAGNTTATSESRALALDEAAPTTTDDVPSTWQAANVPVTLAATDTGGSGLARIRYQLIDADGTAAAEQTYDPDDKPVLTHGMRIAYAASDAAGNVETWRESGRALVDTEAPSAAATVPSGWQTAPVPVTITAADAGASGIASIRYRIVAADGTAGDEQTYDAADRPVLGDREALRYRAIDHAGNTSTTSDTATVDVDSAAPVTTDDVPATWGTAPVTVTLAATDAGRSGIAETVYEVVTPNAPDGAPTTYDPAAKPVLAGGQRLRYWSTDVAGNAETAKLTGPAKVDTTAPTTSWWGFDGRWYQFAPVLFSASDETGGSGVASTRYRIVAADGTVGPEQVWDGTEPVELEHGELARYWSVDEAGNVEAPKETGVGKVDKVAPTVSDDVADAWRGGPVTVTLTAADERSGLQYVRYAIVAADGSVGPTEIYDAASKPVLEHGERLQYSALDNASNASADRLTAKVRIDREPPTASDDVPAAYRSAAVPVTLTAADTGAVDGMVVRYAVIAADGTIGPERTYDPADKPRLADGERLRYHAVDGVGNEGTRHTTRAALVDAAAPVTTDDVPAAAVDGAVRVTLAATDAGGSGGLVTTYAIVARDGAVGTEQAYAPGDRPVLREGERIRYRTRDAAGNVEAARTSGALVFRVPAPPVAPVMSAPPVLAVTLDAPTASVTLKGGPALRVAARTLRVRCAADTGDVRACAVRLLDARSRVLAERAVAGDAVTLRLTRHGRTALRAAGGQMLATLEVTVAAGDGTATVRRTVRIADDRLRFTLPRRGLPSGLGTVLTRVAPAYAGATRVTCTAPDRTRAAAACALVARRVDGVRTRVATGGTGLVIGFTGGAS